MILNTSPGVGMLTRTGRAPFKYGGLGQAMITGCPGGTTPTVRNVSVGVPPGMTCGPVTGGEAYCCCGDPSDPNYSAYADPCSYQNTVAQYSAPPPSDNADANALLSYPNNIAMDAYACFASPGVSFVDEAGVSITCPSATEPSPAGGVQSAYTVQQLAAMLNGGVVSPLTAATTAGTNLTPTPAGPANVLNTVAPTQVQVNQTPAQSNALANGAAQTQMNTPSPSQIVNGSNVTPNTSTQVNSDGTTDEVITWVESNWMLLAAGLAAVIILPSLLSHR